MWSELLITPCLEFPPSDKARVASVAAAVTTSPQPSASEEFDGDDARPVSPITLTNLLVTVLLRRAPSHLVVPPRFIPKEAWRNKSLLSAFDL